MNKQTSGSWRRSVVPLVWPVLLSSIWVAALAGCKEEMDAGPPPGPVTVTVAVPVVRNVQLFEEGDGNAVARYEVKVLARVTGYLDQINFEEGGDVYKDSKKPLFVIDQRPFKAVYDAALAGVALAKASQAYRKAEHDRNKELIKTAAVSQSEFEKSAAALLQSEALIAESEAKAESARLDYEFTTFFTPIDGVTSDAKVDKGNLAIKDQTLLTTIVSVDPINVVFSIDERRLQRIRQMIRDGKVEGAPDGKSVPLEMGLDSEIGYPHLGMIDFFDNQVDPGTGTLTVRGQFDNPKPAVGKRVIMPGMRARVRVPIGKPTISVLVAEQAIGSDQGKKFVYVVNAKNEVEFRRVTVGKIDRGLRVIEEGLKADETILVAGLQRVRPGVTVTPKKAEMASYGDPEPAKTAPAAATTSAAPAAVTPTTNTPAPGVPVPVGPGATLPAAPSSGFVTPVPAGPTAVTPGTATPGTATPATGIPSPVQPGPTVNPAVPGVSPSTNP
jgi:membrane fusion protein, multidrug efflux system